MARAFCKLLSSWGQVGRQRGDRPNSRRLSKDLPRQSIRREHGGSVQNETKSIFREYVAPLALMLALALTLTVGYSAVATHQMTTLAQSISADIQSPSVRVRIVGRTVILEGQARDPSESDRCEAIAIDYLASQGSALFLGATRVLNLISIQKPQSTASIF
jgi:hypothetical protein